MGHQKKEDIKKRKVKVKKPRVPVSSGRIASKHFDIVMGLDFHFLWISGFPVPIPVVPFAALSFDVMDYIHITIPAFPAFYRDKSGELKFDFQEMPMGGTVMINGFHKTIATGGLLALPPIIPPIPKAGGVMKKFSPLHFVIPKPMFVIPALAPHDGEISHGSETVVVESREQSVLMNNSWSCADVGQIILTNPTGFFNNYLTFIVIVIPFGKPVIVGGRYIQHKPTLEEVLNAWLMMGVMHVGKKLLGKALTKLNKALHDMLPENSKVRDACKAVQKVICKYLGEPVDAASGHLTGTIRGFRLEGPLPFDWNAGYFSDSEYSGALGRGMYHSYSHSLLVSEKERLVAFCDADGILSSFPLLERGTSYFHPVNKWELHRNRDGEYYVGSKSGLYYYFTRETDKGGWHQLRLLCDRNGFSVRLSYTNGLLTAATDSVGRTIRFVNDRNGRIIKVEAPSASDPRTMRTMACYAYDERGRMTSVTGVTGAEEVFSWYDGNDKMASRRFKGGHVFRFTYDARGRCTAAEGPQGMFSYYFQYEDGLTVVTDSVGTKRYYYHRDGIVRKETDSRGGERIYHYDENQNLLSEESPDGTARLYGYDERGNTTMVQSPGRGVVRITYNEQDLPVTVIRPNGGTWTYEYDASGNLIRRVNPENRLSEYVWEDGILKELIDPVAGRTRLYYDEYQNLRRVDYPDHTREEWSKDSHGNTLVYTNAKGAGTRYKYDAADRVTQLYLPDGNLLDYTYDAAGNIASVKDRDRRVVTRYNLFGDIVERSDGAGTLRFGYDREGRLTLVTNERGEDYRLLRDSEGDLCEETGFDGITRRYERDYTGRVLSMKLNGKYETRYGYDDLGRLTQIVRPGGSEETYGYDVSGLLNRAANADAEVLFERDVMGRITKESSNGHEIGSTYNSQGLRTRLTSSLGAGIEAAYNPFGDLESLEAAGWSAGFRHDNTGLETERILPGNILRRKTYDSLGRVTGQEILKNVTKVDKKEYLWGLNDRLLLVNDNGRERRYEYDKRGYLTRTQYADGSTEIRVPDNTGNLYETLNGGDRRYGKGGRLIKTERWEYKYDDLGNLVRKKDRHGQTWRYEWNDAGMLSKVKRPDGVEVTFRYDALGRRIEKCFNNRTYTKWVWDGNVPLHEWKETHTKDYEKERGYFTRIERKPLVTWVFEEGTFVPAAKLTENRQLSIVANYMGTPEAMYDDEGKRSWSCELNSYGRVRSFEGEYKTDCPFRYQGQYEDAETGLYYNRFRYYSPDEGIYISQDPIRLDGGLSLYGYVKDVNYLVDRYGLVETKDYPNFGAARVEAFKIASGGDPNVTFEPTKIDPITGTEVELMSSPKTTTGC